MICSAIFLSLSLLFSGFFDETSSLKINLNPQKLSLQSRNQYALKEVFTELISRKDYDLIMSLLLLKTFDSTAGYLDACSLLSQEDYKSIIEYFYANNEIHKLGTILSPSCLIRINRAVFRDSSIVYSLRDLPKNPMALDFGKTFNFRTKTMQNSFCTIVSHALENRFNDIDWDNLVRTSPFQHPTEKILLSEVLNYCSFPPSTKSMLFYYLNPSMYAECNYNEDFLWLMEFVLPISRTSPPIPTMNPETKFVDYKLLSDWNEIIFRTVSTLAFYNECCDMIQYLSQKRHPKRSLLETLEKAKRTALNSLVELNKLVVTMLQSNPACNPLREILMTLNNLHDLFIDRSNSLCRRDVNYLFKSIVRTFSKFSPQYIQGDWMLNLFCLFWKRRFNSLQLTDITASLKVFFSRDPTIYAIKKVYALYINGHDAMNFISQAASFELTIPEDRLFEVYKMNPHILVHRFKEVDFEFRFEYLLKTSRRILGAYNSIYCKNVFEFVAAPCPLNPAISTSNPLFISHQVKLIRSFESTILALHPDSKLRKIHLYGEYKRIEKNLKRPGNIIECLNQFFTLILNIKEFRIITKTAYSSSDPRPVIIVTPLISQSVANVLGQALALSVILNVNVPFVIDPLQLKSIFGLQNLDELLTEKVLKFCNCPIYLNLLLTDKKRREEVSFANSVTSYFKFFYRWVTILLKNPYPPYELVTETLKICHAQINSGWRAHFDVARFSYEEIIEILFKIKVE